MQQNRSQIPLAPITSESGGAGSGTGSSSLTRKKQVRFTNVYDGHNLRSFKDMREEKLQEFNTKVEFK